MISDVAVNGVLFVPMAAGDFRLADMLLDGRISGADLPFRLAGSLDFSARPPLRVALDGGELSIADRQLQISGSYAANKRPYFEVRLGGDSLDTEILPLFLGGVDLADWLEQMSGWTVAHDYDFGLQLGRFGTSFGPLTDAVVEISAVDGFAQIVDARASMPGGTIELQGDLLAEADASVLSIQARIEVDDLRTMLASAGIALRADGVGQLIIEPAGSLQEGALARATLRFFDGRIEELAVLREALGRPGSGAYEVVEGHFSLYGDHVDFSDLRVLYEDEELQFQQLSVDSLGRLTGIASMRSSRSIPAQVAVSGTLSRPRYEPFDIPSPKQ